MLGPSAWPGTPTRPGQHVIRTAALVPVVRIQTSHRVPGLLDGAGQTLAEVATDHVPAEPADGPAASPGTRSSRAGHRRPGTADGDRPTAAPGGPPGPPGAATTLQRAPACRLPVGRSVLARHGRPVQGPAGCTGHGDRALPGDGDPGASRRHQRLPSAPLWLGASRPSLPGTRHGTRGVSLVRGPIVPVSPAPGPVPRAAADGG